VKMIKGEEIKEIPVRKTEVQGRGETPVRMIERTERGWNRLEKKEDLKAETEERTGTDPEVMRGREKNIEKREDEGRK